MIVQLSMAIYLIGVNWLSYAKQIPTKPFLNIPWLLPGWIPLLFGIFYPLYQPKKREKGTFRTLVAYLIILGLVLGSQIKPSKVFTELIKNEKTTSAIMVFTQNPLQGDGMARLSAYLGAMAQGHDELMYWVVLATVIFGLWREIKNFETRWVKLGLRHWLVILIESGLVASGKIQFSDILPFLTGVMFLSLLIRLWKENSNWVVSGLVWSAILMINPMAGIWLVAPIAVIFYPRQYAISWIVAGLINPLMIGGWW